jgi:ubiquitin C-terminal hydrolase
MLLYCETTETNRPNKQTTSLKTTQKPYSYEWRRKVHGIRNYGQTCFMNSVLQSLAASAPFEAYLERVVEMYKNIDDFESIIRLPLVRLG